jgi:hypothetical protein
MEPLVEILKQALIDRGWREQKLRGQRTACGWANEDGDTALSLNEAIVKQLMKEI